MLVAGVILMHLCCILLWPSLLCQTFFFFVFVLLLYAMASVSVESVGFACEEMVRSVFNNRLCLPKGGIFGVVNPWPAGASGKLESSSSICL